MWVFLPFGFFSVVSARAREADGVVVSLSTLMVRSRTKQHLTALVKYMKKVGIGTNPIIESRDTDYRFRIIVPKEDWTTALDCFLQNMDYGNFKSEAQQVSKDGKYVDALHDVWEVMHALQPKGKT